jgi:homoserine kinase type II
MATYTELAIDRARALGAAFGLDVASVRGIPAGSVNSNYRLTLADGSPLFARVYEEQDSIGAEGEARLLDHLAERGVATPRPLPRRDGSGFTFALEVKGARNDGPHGSGAAAPTEDATSEPADRAASPTIRPVALFPWRDGEIVCQARVTVDHARQVGEKLAEVHHAGKTFTEPKPGRFNLPDLRLRLLRIEKASDPALAALVPDIRQRLDRAERERNPSLPAGIIHGDLFRDNVLWVGGAPVALLDFESACAGSFVYDLMVTMMAWCYGDDFDERLVRSLFSGYASKRPLSAEERRALSIEGRIGALRFMITRMTDFAMRDGLGERVMKDYRRFFFRHERLVALGSEVERWCA